MQAVSGMIGSGIPLALVPGGTGNLLAGNLRIPLSPAKAARVIAEGVRRPIDIERSPRPDGIRHFAVAAGVGVDALIMEGATSTLKRRFGMAAYVISTVGLVSRIAPARYRVTVDGVVLEVDAITVVVANCAEVGPLFFSLGPGIKLDDGLQDVVVVTGRGPLSGVAAMWDLFRGGPKGSRILRARGRDIVIETDRVRPVQMDGELAGVTPFETHVLQGAIDVLVPVSVRPEGREMAREQQSDSSDVRVTGAGGDVHITTGSPTEVA
jgi:diacylglycerol kinase family enzyme